MAQSKEGSLTHDWLCGLHDVFLLAYILLREIVLQHKGGVAYGESLENELRCWSGDGRSILWGVCHAIYRFGEGLSGMSWRSLHPFVGL